MVYIQNIVDVKRITFSSGGQEHVFLITNTAEDEDDSSTLTTTAVSLNGASIDVGEFKSLYQAIISMNIKEFGLDYKASGTPEMTITFELLDSSKPKDVLTLYQYNDMRNLLVVNGQGFSLVDYKTPAAFLEKITALAEGREVTTTMP